MYRRKPYSRQSTLLKTGTVNEAFRKMNLTGQKKKPRYSNQQGYCQCNYPVTSWGPCPVPVKEEDAQTRKLKERHFTSAFLCSVWPKYHQPPKTLAGMNEEETAIWVEMLASFKGWKEARTYAQSFKMNGVTGYVLPYLSVKTLRTELDIVKFGHRLEIMAAIENSELTLMNPFVVSIRSSGFFKTGKHFNETHCQWAKKWENINSHDREINKWFSNMPKKTSMLAKSRENGSISSGSSSTEAELTCDPDNGKISMFEGTSVSTPKDDMIFRSGMNAGSYSRIKKVISKSKHSWIPPIKLPPPEFDGMKKLEDLTTEFVRGGEERLSTIFSNAKSQTAASCGCKAPNSCWGSLAVVGGC